MLQKSFADRKSFPFFIFDLLIPGKMQRVEKILHQLRIVLGVDTHRIPDLVLKTGAGQRELVVPGFLL